MIARPLSSGSFHLPDNWPSSVFRLLLLRIGFTIGAMPALAYQVESLFLDYHEDLILLQIKGRFHLRPVRRIE